MFSTSKGGTINISKNIWASQDGNVKKKVKKPKQKNDRRKSKLKSIKKRKKKEKKKKLEVKKRSDYNREKITGKMK